jgi:hypothetical protein
VIKLGLDLHVRQVTECRQLDGSTPKPAQQWDPWKLLNQIKGFIGQALHKNPDRHKLVIEKRHLYLCRDFWLRKQ